MYELATIYLLLGNELLLGILLKEGSNTSALIQRERPNVCPYILLLERRKLQISYF